MMNKVLKNADWKMVAFVAAMSVIVAWFYGRNITSINTITTLPDEFGYLSNAAYFSGTEWAHVNVLYYGYGYSLLLIPFFYICQSGIDLIQGAVFVNVLCTVGVLWIGILLFKSLFPNVNKYIVVLISTVMCFYPYLCVGSSMVICENLLTLVVLLGGYCLLQVLNKENWIWTIMLALTIGYSFFIHTRALVYVGGMVAVVAWNTIKKRLSIKNTIVFCVALVTVLTIGITVRDRLELNVYKQPLFEVMDDVYSTEDVLDIDETEEITIGNVVTIQMIISQVIFSIKHNLLATVLSFAVKNYYMMIGTLGAFGVGVVFTIQESVKGKREKTIETSTIVRIAFVFVGMLMLLACAVQQGINKESAIYTIYGRYFEYATLPIVYIGLFEMVNLRERSQHAVNMCWAAIAICAVCSFCIEPILTNDGFGKNFFRIAAFNTIASETYLLTIQYGTVVLLISFLVFIKISRNRASQWIIPIIVGLFFCISDISLQEELLSRSENGNCVSHLVEYISENKLNDGANDVYYLNGTKATRLRYCEIQGYLGKTQLKVLSEGQKDSIPHDSYVITPADEDGLQNMLDSVLVYENEIFRLYYL